MSTPTQFWTPGGVFTTGREEVNLPPEYMQMIAVLADTSEAIDLGIHCSRCKESLRGKNATVDNRWIMECACRTFIGANPLKRGN
jgi:hypothetical protein